MTVRMIDKRNPLGLELGEHVYFDASCTVEYNDQGEKVIVRFNHDSVRHAVVVGICKKALGTYVSGQTWDVDDYSTPYLHVSRYQLFYKVKRTLYGDIYLVLPEDIVIQEGNQ